jgi:glycosyltransferase involved in cell wall biosynthesis
MLSRSNVPEPQSSTQSRRDHPRPRVLLIGEAANPELVSVPLVGWSHSQAIARLVDAHLVTQIRNRDALIRAGLREGTDFTALDTEAVAARLYKLGSALRGGEGKGWTTLSALAPVSYYYFEKVLWSTFSERLRAREFDLVHRLTPLSPTTPSLIAKRCGRVGVPFVLGPLNGGLPWPRGFDTARRKEKEWLSYVRSAHKVLPGYRSTREHAAAIIVGSRNVLLQMPAAYRAKCVYIPENGIDPQRFPAPAERPVVSPLRIAFVGRLVPYKGADMLIEAAAPLIGAQRAVLDIVGDGPEMPRLRTLVRDLAVDAGVRLHGWIEHSRVQEVLRQSDVFAFPSVREFGGAVVLEAMAVGLVPIVVDYGGPGELVSPTTGFAVPIGSRAEIVAAFKATLERIASAPDQVRSMGLRAHRRAFGLFSWEAKARQTLDVYEWVIGWRALRPDFGMPFPDPVTAAV